MQARHLPRQQWRLSTGLQQLLGLLQLLDLLLLAVEELVRQEAPGHWEQRAELEREAVAGLQLEMEPESGQQVDLQQQERAEQERKMLLQLVVALGPRQVAVSDPRWEELVVLQQVVLDPQQEVWLRLQARQLRVSVLVLVVRPRRSELQPRVLLVVAPEVLRSLAAQQVWQQRSLCPGQAQVQ